VNLNILLKANRGPDRWAWDTAGYRERNRVERLLGKAKQFRRIATRYDKLKATYLGLLDLILDFIRLRRLTNVNTASGATVALVRLRAVTYHDAIVSNAPHGGARAWSTGARELIASEAL
jgi:hypothetical protein